MISSIDSVYADSVKRASDSLSMLAKKKAVIDTTSYQKLMTHPYLPMQTKPSFRINELRIAPNFDGRFYLLIGMLFYLAFIKVTFPKYFSNLFQLIFQSPVRQKQTREQLQQNNLAALFSNILFILNASIFVSLLAVKNAWVDFSLYTCIGLIATLHRHYFLVPFGTLLNNGSELYKTSDQASFQFQLK